MKSYNAKIKKVKTPVLSLAYEDSGPESGEKVILVHGWPDSPRTWDSVLPTFHDSGFRTIVPYLRGYGPCKFRDRLIGRNPRRTGQPVAFAQDVIDLTNRLDMEQFHFIGHDWGARTGYALAAIFAERLKSLTVISVPFEPGEASPPAFAQARAFWYQWLLCSNPGEAKFREDPIAFGRAQWDVWSPPGWYCEEHLADAATSWKGSDFKDVVLHGYRSRWGHTPFDPAYRRLQTQFESTKTISTRTMLIHGWEDCCELKETTDGAEQYFTGGYERVLLNGVGHFPQREDPYRTAAEVLRHIAQR